MLGLWLAAAALGACDQHMDQQPRYREYEPAPELRGGRSLQDPPDGTVARGDLERARALATPPPVTAALLARGRERYDIFCTPCHGVVGDGHGMIVQRGFPAPVSFHDERLRAASPRYYVDVMTAGYGAMFAFASRIPPEDRWAIAAYVRALQLSQAAPVASLPAELRARLEALP